MPQDQSALGFRSVDQNPRYFIDFLDARRSIVGERDVKNLILELLELHAGRHVLDVGCGAGDDAREMAGMVAPAGRVVGIDSSEGMIKEAQARVGASPMLEFRIGEVGKLDFPDNSFDAVRTDRVLMFVSEVDRAISEIHRVLRPGGCVVTSEIDHETHLVDSPYPETSRKLFAAFGGSMPQRHLGRELLQRDSIGFDSSPSHSTTARRVGTRRGRIPRCG